MDALRAAAPDSGAYVNECDYFQTDWQQRLWGSNYPRLLEIVLDAINDWLTDRLHAIEGNATRAAHIAEIWSDLNAAARSTDIYNLDRKPLIFRAFGRLAEAVTLDAGAPYPNGQAHHQEEKEIRVRLEEGE